MKLSEVLKNNASKLNLLSIDVENDEITKKELLFALQEQVIKELNKAIQGLKKAIEKDLLEIEKAKQENF